MRLGPDNERWGTLNEAIKFVEGEQFGELIGSKQICFGGKGSGIYKCVLVKYKKPIGKI